MASDAAAREGGAQMGGWLQGWAPPKRGTSPHLGRLYWGPDLGTPACAPRPRGQP